MNSLHSGKNIERGRAACAFGAFAFCLILLVVLSVLYIANSGPTGFWAEYVEQPKDSIDLLIIGNSHAECTLAPMQFWQEQGITSWILRSGSANTRQKLAFFEEALRTQSPKVVAIEVYDINKKTESEESQNKGTYSAMPNGIAKLSAIFDTASDEQIQTLLFPPLGTYRDIGRSAKNLAKKVKTGSNGAGSAGAGILVQKPEKIEEWNQAGRVDPDSAVIKENVSYLSTIAKRCEDEGIELMLFYAPVLAEDRLAPLKDISSQIKPEYPEVCYLDMNDYFTEIGLKEDDFRDWGHLYLWGMKKATSWWGREVLPTWDLEDRSNDSAINDWWRKSSTMWSESTQISVPQ